MLCFGWIVRLKFNLFWVYMLFELDGSLNFNCLCNTYNCHCDDVVQLMQMNFNRFFTIISISIYKDQKIMVMVVHKNTQIPSQKWAYCCFILSLSSSLTWTCTIMFCILIKSTFEFFLLLVAHRTLLWRKLNCIIKFEWFFSFKLRFLSAANTSQATKK